MWFSIANTLFREKLYYEAALLYEFCLLQNSDFPIYGSNKKLALEKLKAIGKGKAPQVRPSSQPLPIFHVRVFDALLRHRKLIGSEFWPEVEKNLHSLPESQILEANACGLSRESHWLQLINGYLAAHGLRPAKLRPQAHDGQSIHERWLFDRVPITTGPLVSVAMSAFDASETISYAIRSILDQDYQNLELIITDDASSDSTWSIVQRFAKQDPRIVPIRNPKKSGTYKNRNKALKLARGTYFTAMDADDFAHPQRLGMQVRSILDTPGAIATITFWLRMEPGGRILFKTGYASYAHFAVATFLYEKSPVVSRMGYYDAVGFGADMEHYKRFERVFGKSAMVESCTPAIFACSRPNSLTTHPEFGISEVWGSSKVRREYSANWKNWHQQTAAPYIPIDTKERLFPAPTEMLV